MKTLFLIVAIISAWGIPLYAFPLGLFTGLNLISRSARYALKARWQSFLLSVLIPFPLWLLAGMISAQFIPGKSLANLIEVPLIAIGIAIANAFLLFRPQARLFLWKCLLILIPVAVCLAIPPLPE